MKKKMRRAACFIVVTNAFSYCRQADQPGARRTDARRSVVHGQRGVDAAGQSRAAPFAARYVR